jgi:hypothetical protein
VSLCSQALPEQRSLDKAGDIAGTCMPRFHCFLEGVKAS